MGENKKTVEEFVRERSLSLPFLLDEKNEVSTMYGIRSHPMKFLINMQGDVAGIAYGYREWDSEEMKSLIRTLMNAV